MSLSPKKRDNFDHGTYVPCKKNPWWKKAVDYHHFRHWKVIPVNQGNQFWRNNSSATNDIHKFWRIPQLKATSHLVLNHGKITQLKLNNGWIPQKIPRSCLFFSQTTTVLFWYIQFLNFPGVLSAWHHRNAWFPPRASKVLWHSNFSQTSGLSQWTQVPVRTADRKRAAKSGGVYLKGNKNETKTAI